MEHLDFDVVVIGGGHAGVEAAHIAARSGAATALITFAKNGIGVMSCNPAIGGLGKGHLVREIDALGGLMGRVADRSGIQFRLLNRRKGPAVQGPRTQSDRELYRAEIQRQLHGTPNLTILEGEVSDLVVKTGKAEGVVLADGSTVTSRSVVLTTGTFLRGVIHIGQETTTGGRIGERSSNRLAERLSSLGLAIGRLKTGTPPRLRKSSIDWSRLDMQTADDEPVMFSFLSSGPTAQQISCGITHTNEATHDIIRSNLMQSAMYGGKISGSGPRYCPSIEDKVVRFSEKSSHQVFLEPEGLESDVVYPNGISTSLPADVQAKYVHSIVGLEQAEITQPGYAIEYDFVDPRGLDETLQLTAMPNLFLAGQINGTTGYEEAAAQGLIAGLNAALRATGRPRFTLGRDQAYFGVLIDDLITRGVSEPYRMFTSRAEYRLTLRADNADQRLTPLAIELGLASKERSDAFREKMEGLEHGRAALHERSFSPQEAQAAGLNVNSDGKRRTGFDLLAFPNVGYRDLYRLLPALDGISDGILAQLEIDATYATYVERQEKTIEALRRDEARKIPAGFDYDVLTSLSNELKSKLNMIRPSSLAQAGRIEGMTPAALAVILTSIRQADRKSA